MKQLGIRLEKGLWQRLRIRSVEEDRPTSEVVRDAIEQYLSKSAPKKTKVPA